MRVASVHEDPPNPSSQANDCQQGVGDDGPGVEGGSGSGIDMSRGGGPAGRQAAHCPPVWTRWRGRSEDPSTASGCQSPATDRSTRFVWSPVFGTARHPAIRSPGAMGVEDVGKFASLPTPLPLVQALALMTQDGGNNSKIGLSPPSPPSFNFPLWKNLLSRFGPRQKEASANDYTDTRACSPLLSTTITIFSS